MDSKKIAKQLDNLTFKIDLDKSVKELKEAKENLEEYVTKERRGIVDEVLGKRWRDCLVDDVRLLNYKINHLESQEFISKIQVPPK